MEKILGTKSGRIWEPVPIGAGALGGGSQEAMAIGAKGAIELDAPITDNEAIDVRKVAGEVDDDPAQGGGSTASRTATGGYAMGARRGCSKKSVCMGSSCAAPASSPSEARAVSSGPDRQRGQL